MKKAKLVFLDLETTGTNPQKHEIIEIGCVVARQEPGPDGKPQVEKIEEFDIKVKPKRIEDAEPGALRVNKYSESEWLFATEPEDAIKTLAEKTKDAIIVAQNVSFDWAFIAKALHEHGMKEEMNYHKWDLASIAFGALKDDDSIQKFTMRSLCEHFGVVNENAHTALSDARATFEVYKKIAAL
ncbi:hypothetical protein CL654_02240 [bacterium]|nr:hypothetical protein [bacterium]|tara:strand:+ start:1590 stop:2141 length:552 start_codon:yes stop_codon:yes gene_type:complete